MGKYLKFFETDPARIEYEGGGSYVEPYVSYVEGDNSVHYNKPKLFCKLTLSDDSVVELEGSGTLTREMVSDQYKNTLVNAEIGESCTSIGNSAFSICSGLTSVTIPNSVTSIGDGAFISCANLTSVTIPNSVTSIGQGAFHSCAGLTSITIPNSVTSIGASAFYGCTGLTSVTIGSGLTSIGAMAFYGCNGLTSIAIPDNITSIEDAAFLTCSGLTNVTIGSGVTNIKVAAFQACSNLSSVTVETTTPPTLGSAVFTNNASGRKIYVPSGSVNAYKAATNWSDYAADIESIQ